MFHYPPHSLTFASSPPPSPFFKLNYDGASKHNHGNVGYEGIFHDDQRHAFFYFSRNMGSNTNNAIKLLSLEMGLLFSL